MARKKTPPDPSDPIYEPMESGGVAGAETLFLKRSELAILRKHSSRYPIVAGERREAVEAVMKTLRHARTPRLRLSAISTLAMLDRVNLEEVNTYLSAKKTVPSELQPANQVQINVNVGNLSELSDNELIRRHRQSLDLPLQDQNGQLSPGE